MVCILSYRIVSFHIVSYHISYHIISYHITSHHIHHITSHYITSRRTSHVISCHIIYLIIYHIVSFLVIYGVWDQWANKNTFRETPFTALLVAFWKLLLSKTFPWNIESVMKETSCVWKWLVWMIKFCFEADALMWTLRPNISISAYVNRMVRQTLELQCLTVINIFMYFLSGHYL